MQLAILIPTYNYNALALVRALSELIDHEKVDAEIVVGDDASTQDMSWMYEAEMLPHVRLWSTAVNLGRAHILNALAKSARAEWLLIMDADAVPTDTFSLLYYLEAGKQAPVVCGGLWHPDVNPNPKATLRYKYERRADRHRSAAERNLHPYTQLSTFNLLVRRDVFMDIQFDAQCTDYGYEDALFGVELKECGITLLHIDNQLIHMGLEPNAVYLHKAETALRTLRSLDGRMHGNSHVENVANSLRRWHIAWVFQGLHLLFGWAARLNLRSRYPSLTIFSLYKLGYYLSLK